MHLLHNEYIGELRLVLSTAQYVLLHFICQLHQKKVHSKSFIDERQFT